MLSGDVVSHPKEVHVKQQIALAYAIAGLASAIAVIAVVGSNVGWSDETSPQPAAASVEVQADWAPATPPTDRVAVADQQEEVIYVDETGAPLVGPPRRRHHDDDRHDDDDHDDRNDDDHGDRRRDHDDD